MESKHVSVKPEKSVNFKNPIKQARDMLKIELIKENVRDVSGAVIEVVSYPNGDPGGYYWINGDSFNRGDAPIAFDLTDMTSGQPWLNDIAMALWMFGPSLVKDASVVYRWLHAHMAVDGVLCLANEIPWRGKMPQRNEFGHFSDEEIHALLVRSGFENIGFSDEGPYFRLWRATRSATITPDMFYKVESQLKRGNWRDAVEALGELDDCLDTLPAVREYALLLAACHDLAGNTTQSYAALTEALRMDPECGRAMCGLGRLAAIKQDFDGALLFFESALKKSPTLVAALEGRALICELLGDFKSAYEDLVDASNFRPRDEDLLFEVIRLGNLLGYQDELSTFISTRNAISMSWDPSEHATPQSNEAASTFRISC